MHEGASMSGAIDRDGHPTEDHPHFREGIVNWPDTVPRPPMDIEKAPATNDGLSLELPDGWTWVYIDGHGRTMHMTDVVDMLVAMTDAERAQFAKANLRN
jgi:hypothetical protein